MSFADLLRVVEFAPRAVATCGGCARTYTAAAFAALPLPASGRDRTECCGVVIVSRNCACRSTLSRAWCAQCAADLGPDLECPNGCAEPS